jgi:hypothetical protein
MLSVGERLCQFGRRLLLLLAGLSFVSLEAYGTWEFLSQKHGALSFMTLSGVAITAGGASLLPLAAENARRSGHKGLKWAAWCAVPVVMIFVFLSSIQRSGTAIDKDDVAHAQLAEQIRIAKKEEGEAEKQKLLDQGEVAKNCTPWGPKCQRAKDDQTATETKLTAARAVLKVHGIATSDSLAVRLAAYLPFWTKDQINLYLPLIQPLCLSLLGMIFLANGYNNSNAPTTKRRRHEPEPITDLVPVEIEQALPLANVVPMQPKPKPSIDAKPVTILPSAPPKPHLVSSDTVAGGSVNDWVVARIEAERGAKITFRDTFMDYADWCARQGAPALMPDQFAERLAKLCEESDVYTQTKGGTVYLINVRLLPLADKQPEQLAAAIAADKVGNE